MKLHFQIFRYIFDIIKEKHILLLINAGAFQLVEELQKSLASQLPVKHLPSIYLPATLAANQEISSLQSAIEASFWNFFSRVPL